MTKSKLRLDEIKALWVFDEIIETADDKIAEEDEIEAIPDVEPLDEDEKNPA